MYTEKDLLRISKRLNNSHRSYLLINPLQAKHLPVSPTKTLQMMESLGWKLKKNYPETKLVIGFAETATAIGAVVAKCLSQDCIYLTTTREAEPADEEAILFLEEHSHAKEQKLTRRNLKEYITNTETIMFVDDELSTGKTLRNMIKQMKSVYSEISDKRLIAVSLLNRVSDDDECLLRYEGIETAWLLKLSEQDDENMLKDIKIEEGCIVKEEKLCLNHRYLPCAELLNFRIGVEIGTLFDNHQEMINCFTEKFRADLDECRSITVIGTEECMLPAILLGKRLESMLSDVVVRCKATTRSPIGISQQTEYPIKNGNKLDSFYESGRNTYLYAHEETDALVVVSDTKTVSLKPFYQLISIYRRYNCRKFYYLQGGRDVWYI